MSKQDDRSPEPPAEPSFLKKFRVEILSLFLFGSGIFLLLERLEIKQILYKQAVWLLSVFQDVVSYCAGSIGGIQRSDLVGLALVAISVWIMGARFRYRMIQRHPSVNVDFPCPKCNADLKRTHRTSIHRLLQTVFRVRITRCVCHECQFAATVWTSREV